ncbi:MAG: GNAT family N-acetyltransferase [Defluviitaleaceae bacterium]|nr:GNAT family N-acetyltransferase [Defluviitaleaceae bacterium]MCL2837053.1 GNAT family N-acetyltransferase [Defluviitaleaceae bacterium]
MVVMQTERLILRDYLESDLDGMHKLLSDKTNMYFLEDISTDTLEQSAENLRRVMANADGHYFCVRCKQTDEYIGSVGYTITDRTEAGKVVHMGYFILPEFHGRGFTTEAVKRVLEFAFDKDDCIWIITGCYKDNEASRRVMEKAGFIKVRGLVKAQLHDGVMKDRLKYEMTKEDFYGSDEALARLARNGDNAALERLINKYIPMVNGAVGSNHIPGAEREDLLQEGLIGLYGAILAFDPGRASRFYFFAKLCVERRLNTAMKAALRGKHAPLRAYEPIPAELKADMGSPEEIFLGREEFAALENAMNARLSGFERKTLSMRLTGFGNAEIAERLNCNRKVVDNALWRARRKLNG